MFVRRVARSILFSYLCNHLLIVTNYAVIDPGLIHPRDWFIRRAASFPVLSVSFQKVFLPFDESLLLLETWRLEIRKMEA